MTNFMPRPIDGRQRAASAARDAFPQPVRSGADLPRKSCQAKSEHKAKKVAASAARAFPRERLRRRRTRHRLTGSKGTVRSCRAEGHRLGEGRHGAAHAARGLRHRLGCRGGLTYAAFRLNSGAAGPVAGRSGVARAPPAATSTGLRPSSTGPAATGHAPPFGTGLQTPDYVAVPRAGRGVERLRCRDRSSCTASLRPPPAGPPGRGDHRPPAGIDDAHPYQIRTVRRAIGELQR